MGNHKTNSVNKKVESIVKHEGVVSKIHNNVVTVSLKGNINCEACHAKGACGASEAREKIVEIQQTTTPLQLNENVEVILSKNLGLKAVFWAYIFPFILLISTLLIASTILDEWIAGLLALAILIPYYLMLFVLRNSFKKAFKVSILKIA